MKKPSFSRNPRKVPLILRDFIWISSRPSKKKICCYLFIFVVFRQWLRRQRGLKGILSLPKIINWQFGRKGRERAQRRWRPVAANRSNNNKTLFSDLEFREKIDRDQGKKIPSFFFGYYHFFFFGEGGRVNLKIRQIRHLQISKKNDYYYVVTSPEWIRRRRLELGKGSSKVIFHLFNSTTSSIPKNLSLVDGANDVKKKELDFNLAALLQVVQ